MNKRKLFKLVIFGNLDTGNEERIIECRDWHEALKIKDDLLKGRPYFSLTDVMEIARSSDDPLN